MNEVKTLFGSLTMLSPLSLFYLQMTEISYGHRCQLCLINLLKEYSL